MNDKQNERHAASTDTTKQQFDNFHSAYTDVFGKLIRLECELRTLGSTGPMMIAERNFRKSLERVMFVYGSYIAYGTHDDELRKGVDGLVTPPDMQYNHNIKNFTVTFKSLSTSSIQLLQELYGFLRIYYNYNLTRTLVDLDYHLKFYLDEIDQRTAQEKPIDVNAMKGYIRYVFIELEKIMPILAKSIQDTIESGVPLLRVKQKEFTWGYLNMTTIAIFFAGVTVAFLQYTYEKTTTKLAATVNTLLFLALMLSIASGALNLLVLSWRHSYVRSPEAMARRWQSICILSSPIACLTVSGALFVAASCLFLFSSGQDRERTSFVVIPFTAVLVVVVLGLLVTFALHQLKFRRIASDSGLNLENGMVSDELAKWMCTSSTVRPSLLAESVTPTSNRAVTATSSVASVTPTLLNSPESRSPSRTFSPNLESGSNTPLRSSTEEEDSLLINPAPLSILNSDNTPPANLIAPQTVPVTEEPHVPKQDSQGSEQSPIDDDSVPVNRAAPPVLSSNNSRYP